MKIGIIKFSQFISKYKLRVEARIFIVLFTILFLSACKQEKISPPSINGISPSSGSLSGGNLVTISGNSFTAGAVVSIGNKSCAVTSMSSSQITCTAPVNSTGTYNVIVTNPNNQNIALLSGYTYIGTPAVSSVSPLTGFASGGTSVTITGSDFRAGATVDFGGSACAAVLVVNSSSITCTTTAHVAGAVAVKVTNIDAQFGSIASAYTFIAPPSVTSVNSNAGALAGGTAVTITGTGFLPGATIDFGGSACGTITVVSPVSITCTTVAHAVGAVAVTVTNIDSQSGSAAGAYTYQAAPTVSIVSPIAGPIGGGTSVTITGTGFVAGATAKFNTTACTALIVVNSTTITCTTPLQLTTGAVDVVVTNTDTQTGTLTNGYTYNLAPTVTSIAPTSGLSTGATAVTITGTDFIAGATVDFAGSACTGITVVNSTTITCTTAAHAVGLINVSVTNTDNQFGTKTSGYTYTGPPTVTSVSANAGALGGGTAVTITGTGFLAGATIDFGGSACGAITVVSFTSITCTTSAHAAGAVTVTVTNADTQSGNLATAYTYQAAPTVTNVTPSAGALGGATTVNITGTGFLAGATATFGGNACTLPIVVNPTTIQCTTPSSLSVGTVNVVVTNSDTQTGTLTNGYIYLASPSVTSVSLNAGALAGGTAVTITGTNFLAGATIDFGGSACGTQTVVNATTITCTTSAHAAGAVAVAVTNTDSQTGSTGAAYTYQAAPTVTSISPIGGPVAGATAVTITGTGFLTGATVDFGGSACGTINVASATSITCTTSAHLAGAVIVTVTNADTQNGNAAAAFTYQAAPTVSGVVANSGDAIGGTAVTVSGTGFLAGATVDFGGSACGTIVVVNATTITCTTAAHAAGAVAVAVTNADTQSGSLAAAYTYLAAPTVTSIAANAGALAGGTNVTITGTSFVGPATVAIGGVVCTVPTVVNATTITCTTGAHAAGAVNVVVTNADTQIGTGTSLYTYQSAPTVASVSATAGALAGGTAVTITGTNFLTGATVDFGGSACGSINVASATSITCTTTAHVAGAVTVIVTNADTQTGNAAAAYTYQAAPTVSGVVANSGFAIGGTAVTITGTGFIAGATVDFGGSACGTIVVVNATTITCTTAAHAGGAVTVAVTNVDTQSGSLAAAFTYNAAPTVTAISPAIGSLNGSTPVTITGTGFSASGVAIGGVACTGVSVVSATSITCTTGARAAAAVNVVVTNGDTQTGTLTSGFTYQSMAELQWQVGGASPNPPNPDPFGTTATNVTHTYTLKNIGDVVSSAITISVTGLTPAAWLVGTDNCTGTLAAGASCTVQETFLGASLAPTTSFSGVLNASATNGGTATNNMTGSTP